MHDILLIINVFYLSHCSASELEQSGLLQSQIILARSIAQTEETWKELRMRARALETQQRRMETDEILYSTRKIARKSRIPKVGFSFLINLSRHRCSNSSTHAITYTVLSWMKRHKQLGSWNVFVQNYAIRNDHHKWARDNWNWVSTVVVLTTITHVLS